MTFPVFTPGMDLTQPQLLNEMSGLYRPYVTDGDLDRLYSTGSAIYRAANYRADNLALVRWKVYDDKDTALPASDPLNVLLTRGMQDIVRRSELALCFRGRNLIYKVRNRFSDEIVRLQWINFKRYQMDKDYLQGLSGFYVNTGSNDKPIWANYIAINDAIYFTLVDFEDDFDGVAPAEVVFAYAGVDVELGSYLLARFQNMGIPSTMLMPRADNSEAITDDTVKEEADAMRRQVKGVANAGKAYFTPYRWDVEKLQEELSNINLSNISPQVREIIFSTIGVGVSLISATNANFAQAREERMAWIRTWLMPQAHWYAGQFTDQLVGPIHPGYRVEPEFDRVPDALEALAQQTASVNSQVQAGYRDLYSAQVAANDRGLPPDLRLKGYYLVAGIPTKPEDFSKLRQTTPPPTGSPLGGGFGGSMSAPPAAELPPRPPTVQAIEAPAEPSIEPASPIALKSADDDEWMPEEAFKELQMWRKVIARKGADYVFTPKVLPVETVTFGATLVRSGSDINEACKAMRAHYFVAMKSATITVVDDLTALKFDESDHPRADDGKFSESPGGGGGGGDKDDNGKPESSSSASTPDSFGKPFDEKRSNDLSKDAIAKLDKPHLKAVEGYSGIDARIINDNLRGQESYRVLNDADRAQIATIDSAIGSSELPEDTALYRGFTLSPRGVSKVKVGQTITDKAFVSTSLNPAVAEQFSGATKGVKGSVIMRITAPKGTKALPMSTLSEWPGEHEVLLPRGTTFKITTLKKKGGVTYVDAEIS